MIVFEAQEDALGRSTGSWDAKAASGHQSQRQIEFLVLGPVIKDVTVWPLVELSNVLVHLDQQGVFNCSFSNDVKE